MSHVQVNNQKGEGGGTFINTTGVFTGNYEAFRFVENTVFNDITASLFTGISNVSGKTFNAGDSLFLPGVTSFNVASGSFIAYNTIK